MTVTYNPFSEEVMRDPQPVYKKLRAEDPVHHIEEYDAWALAKFEDIWNASMDKQHYTATKGTTSSHLLSKVQPVTPMINLMDPPQHTKLRTAVRDHFNPAKVAKFEPVIREIATKALDEAVERGGMDVMGDMASKVSVTVACLVTGIPLEDAGMMNDLVWRFFGREPGVDGMTEDGLAAMNEMFGYFVQLSQSRKADGSTRGDVIDLINNIEIDGAKLEDMSIASHISMFIIGGSETFPKTFATTIRRLGEHPNQRAHLAANPAFQIPFRSRDNIAARVLAALANDPRVVEHRAVLEQHGKNLLPASFAEDLCLVRLVPLRSDVLPKVELSNVAPARLGLLEPRLFALTQVYKKAHSLVVGFQIAGRENSPHQTEHRSLERDAVLDRAVFCFCS